MKLLITGCHRSLTTLLACMIGAHKDIGLLIEPYYNESHRIASKKIKAIKCPIPTILYKRKRSRLYIHFFRKFFFLFKIFFPFRHYKGRVNYSISDFLEEKIIFISREKEDNINSILKHTKEWKYFAKKDVELAEKIKRELFINSKDVLFITANELTSNPLKICKKICSFLELDFDPDMLEGYKFMPNYNYNRIINKQ